MALKSKKDLKKLLKIVEKRKTPKLNPDQKLSLCVITKNEEGNIARCLESVEGVVDEIIVLDTGSTDRTVEIAREHGAKVSFYEWTNDFSAARNEAIKKATGDWILFLDADEELSETSRDNIRAFMIPVDEELYYEVRIKNIGYENFVNLENYMVRFFKNSPNARYQGRIHEYIIPSNGFIKLSHKDVFILHHGYKDAEKTKEKSFNRNLPILEELLAKSNIDDSYKSFLNYYVGMSNLEEGKMDDAINYLTQSVQQVLASNIQEEFSIIPFIKVMTIYAATDKLEELEKHLDFSKEKYPMIEQTYEYNYYRAYACFIKEKYNEALIPLKKVFECYDNEAFNSFRLISDYSFYFLAFYLTAESLIKLGEKEKALEYLEKESEKAYRTYNSPSYKILVIKLYISVNEYQKAISTCLTTLEKEKLSEELRAQLKTILSNCYMKINEFDKAIKIQAELHEPEKVKISWFAIATSLEDEKFFPAAESVYSVILDILPEEVQAYLGRAVARLIQNKTVEALSDLAFAKKYSYNNDTKIKTALLYLQIGQLTQAKNILKEVLDDNPEDYKTNLYLASIEQSEGNILEAENRLERIISIYPENIDAFIQLGNLFLANRTVDKAIEIFERASNLDSKNPYISYALSISYMENNNKENALLYINKAIELDSDNEELFKIKEILLNN